MKTVGGGRKLRCVGRERNRGWLELTAASTSCAWPGSRLPRRRRSAPSGRSGSPQKHPEPGQKAAFTKPEAASSRLSPLRDPGRRFFSSLLSPQRIHTTGVHSVPCRRRAPAYSLEPRPSSRGSDELHRPHRRPARKPLGSASRRLDSILSPSAQLAPCATQSVVAGRVIVTSRFESGLTLISQQMLLPLTSRRPPSPPP